MKKNKKVIVIIQARADSSRLPNKVLLKLNGVPALLRMTNRVALCKLVDEIWIATGKNSINDPIEELYKNSNINVYRGNDLNVLSRYYEISKIS